MRLPILCFGKLPLHREYLRVRLDGPAGRWLVRWVEELHESVNRGIPVDKGRGARFSAPVGDVLVCGVVRDSSDGLRRHPIALAVETAIPSAASLVPIALEVVWETLTRIIEAPSDSVAGLTTLLRDGLHGPDVEAAFRIQETAFRANEPTDPWARLSGVSGDVLHHLAINLRAVGRAQAEARSPEEGVAVRVPLGATAPTVHAAAWLAALDAAATRPPHPTVVLLDGMTHLVVSYRPFGGRDLALALAGDDSTIDDLADAWQTLPPASPSLAAVVAAVGGRASGSLDDLLASVRAVVAA